MGDNPAPNTHNSQARTKAAWLSAGQQQHGWKVCLLRDAGDLVNVRLGSQAAETHSAEGRRVPLVPPESSSTVPARAAPLAFLEVSWISTAMPALASSIPC